MYLLCFTTYDPTGVDPIADSAEDPKVLMNLVKEFIDSGATDYNFEITDLEKIPFKKYILD